MLIGYMHTHTHLMGTSRQVGSRRRTMLIFAPVSVEVEEIIEMLFSSWEVEAGYYVMIQQHVKATLK